MLANTQTLVPVLYQILKSMEESNFEFFLTGSRYFGGHREDSDHDFFVMEGTAVEEYLRANGFMLETECMYEGDPTFTKVLTLITDDGVIQVQLIKSALFTRKQLVQRLLYNRYREIGLPGDKSTKRELWHLAYHIAESLGIS